MLMSIKNVDFNKRSLIFHLNYAWLFQRSRRSEKILISRFYDTSFRFYFFFFDALLKRFKFRINILSQHRNNFNFSSVFWNWFLRKFVNDFQYILISFILFFIFYLTDYISYKVNSFSIGRNAKRIYKNHGHFWKENLWKILNKILLQYSLRTIHKVRN